MSLRSLTPDVIEQYQRDGAILLRGVFDIETVEQVKRGIEYNIQNPSPFSESLVGSGGPGAYFDDYCNWRSIPEFKEYVWKSPAAQIAGLLMNSQEAVFYHEHVLVKQPQTTKETPWHHDQPYYPIDGDKVCSIWMPVDSVSKETSIMFAAGSHLSDRWFIPRTFANSVNYTKRSETEPADRAYEDVPDIDAEKYKILQWGLEPGDCIVFHMRTLHGAPGNISESRSRRILSTRWLGDDAKIATRPWETSPPELGGLNPGDRALSDMFPLIWKRSSSMY